ncbi:hypothetical protein GN277_18265 [Lachnospiraceae bacterium WCA-9-b2]|uniref:YopX protein domain-containing protein n=1 Tax=Sporofaciens musculi TaxID=2681861 RepID=A0A7X3MIW1_9FIRM|nr:YopX family protein [Sporofaciens musculi]MXP77251.1 hypothetical protein [Sporofaciens musculi]
MGREILFRAKHIHKLPENKHLDGKWVEGYLADKAYINSPELEGEFLVDESTICQYTGLTDNNGRKIFEGDIVKTSQYGVDDGNGHNYAGFDTFSVEFSDGGFCLKNKWRRFNLRPLGNFEVIGNIFDNPELIAS